MLLEVNWTKVKHLQHAWNLVQPVVRIVVEYLMNVLVSELVKNWILLRSVLSMSKTLGIVICSILQPTMVFTILVWMLRKMLLAFSNESMLICWVQLVLQRSYLSCRKKVQPYKRDAVYTTVLPNFHYFKVSWYLVLCISLFMWLFYRWFTHVPSQLVWWRQLCTYCTLEWALCVLVILLFLSEKCSKWLRFMMI